MTAVADAPQADVRVCRPVSSWASPAGEGVRSIALVPNAPVSVTERWLIVGSGAPVRLHWKPTERCSGRRAVRATQSLTEQDVYDGDQL